MSGVDVCHGMWTNGSASLRQHAANATRLQNGSRPFFASRAECAERVYREKTCHEWRMLPTHGPRPPTYFNDDLEEKILTKAKDEPGQRFLSINDVGVCDATMAPDAIVCREGKCFQRQPRAYEGVQVQCSLTRQNGFGCTCDAIAFVDGVFGSTNEPSTFETCRFQGWNNESGWDDAYKAPITIVTPPPVPHNWNRASPDMAAEAVIDAALSLTSKGESLVDHKISVQRDPATGAYKGASQLDLYGHACHGSSDCGGTSPFCVKKLVCTTDQQPYNCSAGMYTEDCDTRPVTECHHEDQGVCKECTRNNGTQCKDAVDANKAFVCTVPANDGTGMGICTKEEFTGNLGQKCQVDDDCDEGNATMCRGGICKQCDKNNGRECLSFVCDTERFVCKLDEFFVGNVGDKCVSADDCGGIAKYCQSGMCKQCDKNNNTQCDYHVCDISSGRCTDQPFVGNIGDACKNRSDCAGTASICTADLTTPTGRCVQCIADIGDGVGGCGGKVCDLENGKCTDHDLIR